MKCSECPGQSLHPYDRVPLRLADGSTQLVEPCLARLLQALNDAGIPTTESCCGHGKNPAAIYFAPGPAGVRFASYGCCGEDWIVTLSWQHGEYLQHVIDEEKKRLEALT